jgi:hypothetical protein
VLDLPAKPDLSATKKQADHKRVKNQAAIALLIKKSLKSM